MKNRHIGKSPARVNTFIATILLIFPLLSLSSCGDGGKASYDSSNNYDYAETTAAYSNNSRAKGYADEVYPSEYEYSYEEMESYSYDSKSDLEVSATSTANEGGEYEKKIIKNADISLRSEDVSGCYQNLLDFAKKNGGYESSCQIRNYGDYDYITAVIKILPQNLDVFLNYAGESATLMSRNVYSDDISSQYYDSVTRLNTLRKSLEKYYEFLESTTTVKDMLTVQNEINNLTLQIESYEGQIKYWSSMVAEATVSITIDPIIPDAPVIEQREINWTTLSLDDMIYLLKSGFMNVINVIVTFVQWIVIIFVSALPVIVILGIVVIIIIISHRRRVRIKKAKADDTDKKNE